MPGGSAAPEALKWPGMNQSFPFNGIKTVFAGDTVQSPGLWGEANIL